LRPAGFVGSVRVPPPPGVLGAGDQRPAVANLLYPASLSELRIHNLELSGAAVDLLLVHHTDDVGVNVLRREGDVQIVVMK
jgi:hypothetical protein